MSKACISTVLCLLMVHQPIVGVVRANKNHARQGEARVVHALNRLTFGPRPMQIAAVERAGLDRWFEKQLNPAEIDDSALEARLADYPATKMSISELEARYPGSGAIREMEYGRIPLPSDPTARAIAVDEIAFYKVQKARKEQKSAADVNGGVETTTTSVNGQMRAAKASFDASAAFVDTQDVKMMAQDPLTADEIAPDGAVLADEGQFPPPR
jgi:hypothetical protein